jgi:histidinol-phosphate aminotransferase
MNRRDWIKSSGLLATSGLWSDLISKQTACHSFHAESEGDYYDAPVLRLGSNENPYGTSPKAKLALIDAMPFSNRYVLLDKLKEKIGATWNLSSEFVIPGAGSAEILGLSALSHFHDGSGSLITPRPTFFVLPSVAEKLGAEVINIKLTADKLIDLESVSSAIKSNTRMIYLCNPNNPTGTKLPYQTMRNFVESVPSGIMIVVDEVYLDFVEDQSLIPLVNLRKNLIIIKSFSKVYGLAGMRLGYGLAHPDTIKSLEKFVDRAGNGISHLTYYAGIAALDDHDFVKMYLSKNNEAKEVLYSWLRNKKVEHYYSHANCTVFSMDKFDKLLVSKLLKDDKILVRQVDDWGHQYCRVSIGTPEEMRFLNEKLEKYLL